MSSFFVNRPIVAMVISIVIVLLGVVAMSGLPIAQYPEIVPPMVQVTTTLSFQWDRIEYSSIIESFGSDDETVDDVDELHLGGEYMFLHSTPIIAVRLGMWLDPDHQIRATSDDPFFSALLPRGEDQMHYTAGAGVAFQSFQADLGVDLSDRVNTVSLSAVYSF